jgi:NhaA family Na+:H+ antiporter
MRPTAPRSSSALRAFFNSEASGGIVLMGAAALALVANSPVSSAYFGVLHSYVLGLSVLHWVNDASMTVFFLMVGVEIKREMLDGQLST